MGNPAQNVPELTRDEKLVLLKQAYEKSAREVNCMLSMNAGHPLNLSQIRPRVPSHATQTRARPCRIYWREGITFEDDNDGVKDCGYAVQIFPRGVIQLLGKIPRSAWPVIHHNLSSRLNLPQLSFPVLSSCTIHASFPPNLLTLSCTSSALLSNERELFPGILIARPKRAHRYHLALFHNGHCVITGVKRRREGWRRVLKKAVIKHHLL